MKTCPYCGTEYPDGTQVCPADRNVLVPTDPTNAASSDETGPLTAPIKFDSSVQGMKWKYPNLRFHGSGSIEILPEAVILSGKQRRLVFFGTRATERLKPTEIFNVECESRQVRFVFQPRGGQENSSLVAFDAESDEEAARIAERLPRELTPEYRQVQEDRQDFGARLVAATPRTFVTHGLIALNVLVFVLMAFAGAGVLPGDSINPDVHTRWGANFGPLTTDGQWWRLLTSAFLHFGILHLALNMWALYAAGTLVERLYGNAFFLFLYLAAGVTGSVASVWWNPKVLSAGASGALFGVYGGLLAYLLLQRGSVPATMMAQMRNSFLTCVAYNLLWGLSHPGIDNAAHLGGLVGGALTGLALSRPLNQEERARPTWVRWLAGGCVAVLLPGLLWSRVPNSGEPYRQEQQFRADVQWFTEEEQGILASWKEGQREAVAKKSDAIVAAKFRPLIARWEQAQQRLASAHLESDTPLSRRQQLLLEYIGFRRDAMKALVEALDGNDQNKVNRFKALESRAQATLEALKSIR